MAVIAQNHDWDWQTAEQEYRRAIQLDPNYATAHRFHVRAAIGVARQLASIAAAFPAFGVVA